MSEISWKCIFLAFVFIHCQTQAAQLQERIVDGSYASSKQFPYQVFLHNKEATYYSRCGGVIIADRLILTAAHCVHDIQSVDIYLGALNIRNVSEDGQVRITVAPQHILIHKDYNNTGFVNDDIALIKLPVRLIFNDYIQPAKLPVANDNYTGDKILASGWGLMDVVQQNNKYVDVVPTHLKFLEGHILSPAECKAQFVKLEGVTDFFLDTWICMISHDSNVCLGDSGGAVVVPNSDNSVTLVSINSFGFPDVHGMCSPEVASFGTRVSSYLDWIKIADSNLP